MTREEILEAAAGIFREKGFHAASMQDIAHAVNLQKASLYHHVSSKQEILSDLLNLALDLLIERLEAVVAQPLPPEEKLNLAVRNYLEDLAEHRNLATVLLLEHRSLAPEYQQEHFPRRDRYEDLWQAIIEEGIAQGVFEAQKPGLAVKALLGQLNWTIMWYRPDGPLTAGQIADLNAHLFTHGLMAR